MNMIIDNLIRKKIKNLISYQPSKTVDDISKEIGVPVEKILKIDSGENLYVELLQNKKMLDKMNLYLYPDPECKVLREKLSSYTKYPPEWIVCGNGSDELIDLLIRTFISQRDEIIISPPTFSMYAVYGQLQGAKIKSIFRNKDFSINTDKILRNIISKTKIVFIDSPGNPTSVTFSTEAVGKLLKRKIIVVVDEAYFEYCGQTVLPLVKKYPNLVVLRTFSKWAGLAGLRVGYMVANPKIINIIQALKPPYNVNSTAQIMASEALDNKDKYFSVIKQLVRTRGEFVNRLSGFSHLNVYPTAGAYIIFKPIKNAQKLSAFLKLSGVLVKFINQPLLENCIRVNLVNQNDMDKFILILMRFYEN